MFALKAYAIKIKDREKLLNCSSGGAFIALSQDHLAKGNAIVCAKYDYDNNETVFILSTSIEDRDKSCGSKYMQAYPGDIYKECETWLNNNKEKKIMFFGLGCQAASFRKYMELRQLSNRIIVVDIICHGVPSPLIWKEYIRNVTKGRHLSSINFRDKKNGWDHSVATIVLDGKEISIQDYRRLYSSKNITRPSCYFCPYTKVQRISDITIGDFWHIENRIPSFYDPKGVSLVLVHTPIGESVFDNSKNEIDFTSCDIKDCMQYNLEKPTQNPVSRYNFWVEHRVRDMEFLIKRYGKSKSFIDKLYAKLFKALIRVGIKGQ